MNITFHFHLPLNQRLNCDTLALEVKQGATLQHAIEQLIEVCPNNTRTLFHNPSQTTPSFLVYMVNQQKVGDTTQHQLTDNDQITVLSPMAGG